MPVAISGAAELRQVRSSPPNTMTLHERRAQPAAGGAGYTAEPPIEVICRNARAFRIGEGPSEIKKTQAARSVLGKEMCT